MKKLSLLFVLLLSVSIYAKNDHTGPGPFWYSISEKILTSAHQLLSPDETPKATKVKPKAKPVKCPLKCQPKQEKKIMPKPVYGSDQNTDTE